MKNRWVVGQRVEIENFGEGTIVSCMEGDEVEVALSELETYRFPVDIVLPIQPE